MLAILLIITGSTILAGMDSLGKVLMQDFHSIQVTWARFTFHTFIVVLVFGWQSGRWKFVVTRAPKIQFLRGLCMLGVNTSLYIAIMTISLAEGTALTYLSPILVTLLAGVFLGERMLFRHVLAVIAGFLGVLIIIRPGFQVFEPAMLLALLAAFSLALYFLLTRKVAGVDGVKTSLFYASVVAALALSCVVPIWWVMPNAWQWLLFLCLGSLGAIGHFLFIKAYTLVSASELSPWLYAQVIAATLFSVFLFQDQLDVYFFMGTGLIISAGILLWFYNRQVT